MPKTWQTLEFIKSIATVIETDVAHGRTDASKRELLGLKGVMPLPLGSEPLKVSSSDDTDWHSHREAFFVRALRHNLPPNAAVQRPRDQLSSATHVHNEMAHVRRARADLSRSAATAC